MTSIKLFTYPRNSNEEEEEFFVDFENDYADVFPTGKHLQEFLQNFLDIVWQSQLEKQKASKKSIEMKNFCIVGGDDESIEIRYSIFEVVQNVNDDDNDEKNKNNNILFFTAGTCEAILPEDPIQHFGAAAFAERERNNSNNSRPRRMNDGGEFVDELDEDDFDDGAEYY